MSRKYGVRTVALVVSATAMLALTGCTPGPSYGVLLNADASVDFVFCSGVSGPDFSVNYLLSDDDAGPAEWVLKATVANSAAHRLIEYGVAPPLFDTVSVTEPPDDWTVVEIDYIRIPRSDLTVGEWRWETEMYPWIPDRPCVPERLLEN
jgi:hypothetical protein